MFYKIVFYVINFIVGSLFGSFINVLWYRIPKNISFIKGRSKCPYCQHDLGFFDLIPFFSYIFLKGKCRYCRAKISFSYFVVEFLTGLFFVLISYYFGWGFYFLKWAVFIILLFPIALIDFSHQEVPDILTVTGMIFGFVLALIEIFFIKGVVIQQPLKTFLSYFFGFLLGGGFFGLIVFLTKGKGMGEGDITLGLMIGAFLGLRLTIVFLFLSFILGGIGGVINIIFFKKKGRDIMAFGPYMATAALLSLIYGNNLIYFYLTNFFYR